jgi:hypothetical protein
MPSPDGVPPALFFVFVVLAGTGSFFFILSRNAPLKRRLWPAWMVLVALGFLAFAWGIAGPAMPLILLVPIALITFLNLRNMRFCDACGRTVFNAGPFSRAKFCPACGAAIR